MELVVNQANSVAKNITIGSISGVCVGEKEKRKGGKRRRQY